MAAKSVQTVPCARAVDPTIQFFGDDEDTEVITDEERAAAEGWAIHVIQQLLRDVLAYRKNNGGV